MPEEVSLRIEHLTKQCEATGAAIGSLMVQTSRVIAIGTAVALGVIGLALRTKSYEVLMLLPFLIFVLFFHYVNLHTSILELGGYKRFLEEQINVMIGEKIYLWETELVSRRHMNIANHFLGGIFVVILLCSSGIGIYVSYTHKYHWVFYPELVLICVLGVGSIGAVIHMKGAHVKTYKDALNASLPRREVAEDLQ